MDGLEAWGRGGKGVDLETLGLDAASWLEGNGVFTTQEVLRENFVETVGDLAFVGHSESALTRLGFDAMTTVEVWDHLKPLVEALASSDDEDVTMNKPEPEPEPVPAPKSIFARKRQAKASESSAETDLRTGVGDWLAEVGASECERAFRENMVETLGDVAFLVSSRSDLTGMGLSSVQAGKLWGHVASLSSASDGSTGMDTGQPAVDSDEDVSSWLSSNGALGCEDSMREAMVETVGDLLFLVDSKTDLSEMGLSNPQIEAVWGAVQGARNYRASPELPSGDDDTDSGAAESNANILAMDAAKWLAERGQASAEDVLRENMVETVADLTFLISSVRDMAKVGFAPVAQQDLWPHIEKLSALAEKPAKKGGKKTSKAKAPQATGDYKADVGGKNDPRLGWGALLGDDGGTPTKKTGKGGKKKGSSKAAEKKAAAAEKAAAEKSKQEEAKAERAAQKAAERKAKAMEARKKKKAAAEAKKKKKAEAKKVAAEQSTPRAKKVKDVSSRLSQPTNRPVGNETPKSESEMTPRPKKGRGKIPRCATVSPRLEESDGTAEFSPQLDWALQRKLLDKIEQETRRREHLEWLEEERKRKEEEADRERRELRATYNHELRGPAKVPVGTNPAVARAKQKPTQFKMSPGSARLVGNDDGMSFVERQELRMKARQEKIEARKSELAAKELAEVTAQPALSKASLKMTKETIHASLSKEERIERLTSPVRLRSPPRTPGAQALGSPMGTTPTPRRRRKKLGSPQASSVERLSKTSSRDRLRKEGQAQAVDLPFQPAINNTSRDMATRRRSPRGARNLGSPSRGGVASALSSIKTNIKSVWDAPGGVDIENLFEHYDKDQDGWLSFSEWTRAVRRDGIAVGSGNYLSDEEHRQIFDYVDMDQDGYISLPEFRQFLQPKSRRGSRRTTSGGRSPPKTSSRDMQLSPAPAAFAGPPPVATPEANGLGAPPAPTTLPAASAELIEHCAEWVARHGQQFETILKNRNFGQPDTPSAEYYRQRLEHEMQQQITESAKRCETIYGDLTSGGKAEPQPEPEPATAGPEETYEPYAFNDGS